MATKTAKKAPKTTAKNPTINYMNDFSPGKNCVLYHVRRPLKTMTVSIPNWVNVPEDMIDKVKAALGDQFSSKIKNTSIKAIAKILSNNGDVNVTCRENEIDHTVAIGYNPEHKAMVVSYAKPRKFFEEFEKSVGHKRALVRLEKAQRLISEGKIYTDEMYVYADVPNSVREHLAHYLTRAKRFFKDQEINTLLVYAQVDGKMGVVKASD